MTPKTSEQLGTCDARADVLKQYPDAVAEQHKTTHQWTIYSQKHDRFLTEHTKGSEDNAWKSARRKILKKLILPEQAPVEAGKRDYLHWAGGGDSVWIGDKR